VSEWSDVIPILVVEQLRPPAERVKLCYVQRARSLL
jgi:hypothetical protein